MVILFSASFLIKCVVMTNGSYSYAFLNLKFVTSENTTRFQYLRKGLILMVSDSWLKSVQMDIG